MPKIRARSALRFGTIVDHAIVPGNPDRREPNWFDGLYNDQEKIARELAGRMVAEITSSVLADTMTWRSYGLGSSRPWSKDKWHPMRNQVSK
jgi:hypothetical protein